MQKNKPIIIAGPCSAESETQVLETAHAIKQLGMVDIFRAGIWKPRTNPGGFEGVGSIGLQWLLKARAETGLALAIEVGDSKHVEEALAQNIDYLWVGARTTANPFSVQNLAEALQGTHSKIFIKNPVNADIKLWIGAVERMKHAGLKDILLIHRGFTQYGNTKYRNVPMWQIPIEMKRLFPELPMICDPSHICGNRISLFNISQKAVDLDYDGVMIESHINPDVALTDSFQQITPAVLGNLLSNIVWKKQNSDEIKYNEQIEHLRNQINYIDEEIMHLIANRMTLVKEIGDLKKFNKITVLQSERYNHLLQKALQKGEEIGLSEQFVKTLIEALHIESINKQE